jgi:hypothetical protein
VTSVGDEMGVMVRMLERLPAGELDRLLLDLGGAPRVEREVAAQRFRPLPSPKGPSRVIVRTRIVQR